MPTGPRGIARFREQDISFASLGTFQGATEVWRTRVFLLSKAQTVGYGAIACVHVTASIRECWGTYTLPRGLIRVAGQIMNRRSFKVFVVGGSGIYAHAEGTLAANGTADVRALVFNFGS